MLLWSTDTPHVDSTNLIVIIKVFIKCKILPVETILSTYMCTHTHTLTHTHTGTDSYEHMDYTKLNLNATNGQ